MKKNKKIAGLTLVTLLAPTLLNAHFAFAEGTQPVPVEQQEVVTEKEEQQPEVEKEADSEKQPEAKPELPTEETKPESKPEQESPKEESKETAKPETEKEVDKKESSKGKETKANTTVVITLTDATIGTVETLSYTREAGTTDIFALPLEPGRYEFISSSDPLVLPVVDETGQLGVQITFPSSPSGVYNIDVTVKLLDGIVGGNVYVKHLDDLGNELTDALTILGGFIGEKYTTEPKNIPGYTLVDTPLNNNGTFTDTDQTVTYRYDRVQTTVSVVCADENGVPLGDVVSRVGKFNDTFTITVPEISGYEYLGMSQSTYSNASTTVDGTYGLEDQHFVANYRKIVDIPTVMEDPTANIQTQTIANPLSSPIPARSIKKDNKTLPETGEAELNSSLVSMGVMLIAAVYFTKKKRADEFNL